MRETWRRIGLARALSKLGYCSRSQAAKLIQSGRVRVNGNVCREPETPVRIEQDSVAVDGAEVRASDKTYWMMNKPRGAVTSASDEKGRETVYAVLDRAMHDLKDEGLKRDGTTTALHGWLAPVGRLDKASEGLLLLTNDSEWGARVGAPETHLEKTYHVQVATLANDGMLKALVRGAETGERNERECLRARRARVLRSGKKNCWLEIVLDEGKNRQIRRMLEAFRVDVLRLVRVRIGPLPLGNLTKGACRPLTLQEKLSLDRAMRRRSSEQSLRSHDWKK